MALDAKRKSSLSSCLSSFLRTAKKSTIQNGLSASLPSFRVNADTYIATTKEDSIRPYSLKLATAAHQLLAKLDLRAHLSSIAPDSGALPCPNSSN